MLELNRRAIRNRHEGIEIIGANKTLQIDVSPVGEMSKTNGRTAELSNEIGNVRYRANQIHGQILLIAEGGHEIADYEVFFEQSPIDIFPPQFILKHRKPNENAVQIETDFTAETSFKVSSDAVGEVTVHDSQGKQPVWVNQTHD